MGVGESVRPFIHLHNHSDFSLLDGASRIHEIVDLAAQYKMPAVALTDHGNMFGAIAFFQAAKEKGVKPILGCEIYVAPGSRFDRSPGGGISDTNNHLILLAESYKGYTNLVKLVTAGYLEGFYYKPRIDKELLATHSEGLIGLSACLKGEVPSAALRGAEDAMLKAAGTYEDILGKGNFFLEIQDQGLEEEVIVNTRADGPGAANGSGDRRNERLSLHTPRRRRGPRHSALYRDRQEGRRHGSDALPRRGVLLQVLRGDGRRLRGLPRSL